MFGILFLMALIFISQSTYLPWMLLEVPKGDTSPKQNVSSRKCQAERSCFVRPFLTGTLSVHKHVDKQTGKYPGEKPDAHVYSYVIGDMLVRFEAESQRV